MELLTDRTLDFLLCISEFLVGFGMFCEKL